MNTVIYSLKCYIISTIHTPAVSPNRTQAAYSSAGWRRIPPWSSLHDTTLVQPKSSADYRGSRLQIAYESPAAR